MVEPCFKQMCCNVNSHVFAQQIPVETIASREWLRMMCEPLFEEMITALQQSILQQSTRQACFEHAMSNVSTVQSMNQPGVLVFPFQATPVYRPDDESTEASDSCAFTSLFSVMSSEGETLDVIERRSDISEPP